MLTPWMQIQLFFRSFFLQAGWNYSKYQHVGLAFAMYPFLRKLYTAEPQVLPSVLQRYLESFNTQPAMVSFCMGALARQEERIVQANTVALQQQRLVEWNGIKRSLSITAASIGDRLFWGTLKPLTLLLALCAWLVGNVNFLEINPSYQPETWEIWGAIAVAFVVFNSLSVFVRWKGIGLSYFAHDNGCFGLTRYDWNKTIYYAKWLGIFLSVAVLLWGVFYFIEGWKEVLGIQFITRGIMVLFFVSISFITRGLRIPNMYIYITAMILFNLVCVLHI